MTLAIADLSIDSRSMPVEVLSIDIVCTTLSLTWRGIAPAPSVESTVRLSIAAIGAATSRAIWGSTSMSICSTAASL